jgi:hypothetical protein
MVMVLKKTEIEWQARVGIVCCSLKETTGMSEEALCFPLKYHTH